MAYIQNVSKPPNTTIDKFYGLNMNETGDTQLQLGESGKMINFRITKDNKLEKMYGYKQVYKKERKNKSTMER